MVRELVLVRHAKSDWGDPSIGDHDRPLNARGERTAPVMARGFAESGHGVDVILSSTALRARTTAQVFAEALGMEVTLDRGLYMASAGELLAAAQGAGVDRVMLVAHNPGLSQLAARLSGGEITHLPTCAVGRFAWDDAGADRPAGLGGDALPRTWHLDTPR